MRLACPRARKSAARTNRVLLGRLQTGRTQGKSTVRKTEGVCKKAGCIARGQRAPVRGAAMQTGKESNKRKELLTAALRALCGRAWEKKETGKPAEIFCFSGSRRSINLLGRLQIFGWFVGNGLTVPCGLTDSMMCREVARHSARFYALRAASGAVRSLRPQARFGAQPPHSGGS